MMDFNLFPPVRFTVVMEITIYIDVNLIGHGIGAALMKHLVTESEKAEIWTLYAAIFPEKIASIRRHQRQGFVKYGFVKKSDNGMEMKNTGAF